MEERVKIQRMNEEFMYQGCVRCLSSGAYSWRRFETRSQSGYVGVVRNDSLYIAVHRI